MAKSDLTAMRAGDKRSMTLGDQSFTIERRAHDFRVTLGANEDRFEVAVDPFHAIGAAVVRFALDAPDLAARYDWLVRWHLEGEAQCARQSKLLGIHYSTRPATVWQMIKSINPTAFCDEITNLTLSGEEA